MSEHLRRPGLESHGSVSLHDHATEHRSTRVVFAILALVQVVLIFTITLIVVPLPQIGREFGLTSADLLLVLTGYGLPFSGLLLFGGRLSDRFGGGRIFALGLSIFGGSSFVAGLAPSYEVLLAMRFGQGIGAALTAPAAMAVLRALFPEPVSYGRAMATWGGLAGVGAVLGFVVSGIANTWVSWRWMFIVPVVGSLLGLWAVFRGLPSQETDLAQAPPSLDPIGAVLATVGISLSSYALVVTGDYGWLSVEVLVPLVIGLCLLVAFVMAQRKVRDPLLPPGFVREPYRAMGLYGMFMAAAGSGLVNFVLSLFWQQQWGWSPLKTALAFLPFSLALILTNRLAGPLIARVGLETATIAGWLVSAVGLMLFATIEQSSSFLFGIVPGSLLSGFGMALVFSGSAVLATRGVPAHQTGLAAGVMNMAMELGPTVGLAVFMSVAATQISVVQGYAWALAAAALAYLAGAGMTALVKRRSVPEGMTSNNAQ